MFFRLGSLVYRYRWWIIAFWLAGLAASLPLAPRVGDNLKSGGFASDRLESAEVGRLLDHFGQPSSSLLVVFQSRGPSAPTFDDPRYQEAVARGLEALRGTSGITEVRSPLENRRQVAADRRTAYAVVALDPDASSRGLVSQIQARLRDAAVPSEGLRVFVSGASAFYADIEEASERDLRRAELAAFPLGIIALLLLLRSVVAAAVPILIGASAVVVAMAALFLTSQRVDLSVFVLNVATMLGLGLSIDYALFLTTRFREELRSRDVPDAVRMTVGTAGKAVFFSGLTVLGGLLGLLTFDSMMLRSVGLGGLFVVLTAAFAALTLLPALLAIVGHRIDALPIPIPRGLGFPWARLARLVMSHPLPISLAVLAVLLLLGSPFLRIRLSAPDAGILPSGTASREGFEVLRDAFGDGEVAPILVIAQSHGSIVERGNLDALYAFTRQVAADPRVARVESIVDLDPRLSRDQYELLYARDPPSDAYARRAAEALVRGDTTLVSVASRYPMSSDESQALVRDIRQLRTDRLQILVGGGSAGIVDYVASLYSDVPRAVLVVVVAVYLALSVLFRSVVLALKAVVMNTLSLLASYGALVAVFQEGQLSELLGFTPASFVEASLPIIMFCFLFGVSMDYEVFLLSRVKEAYDHTSDNAASVAQGLQLSGGIITGAALIVVVVSASFVAADIVLIKALGLGTALAVLLDATIVRALLVPATMRLLGDLNWWFPKRQDLRRLVALSRQRSLRPARIVPRGRAMLYCGLAALALLALSFTALLSQASVPAEPSGARPAARLDDNPRKQLEPIVFPADEAPHDNLTEWWYYTGHLAAGQRAFGFQLVTFQSRRANAPAGRAAHFAITDRSSGVFYYDQRAMALDEATVGGRLDLRLGDWQIIGQGGRDHLAASSGRYALELDLVDAKPPALHNGNGVVSFGPAGISYYYSRTRLSASGSLSIDGQPMPVLGYAWMDHQWGDFLVLDEGGWDWFGLQLDDDSELALSLVRDASGRPALRYGLYVDSTGRGVHIPEGALDVVPTKFWSSPMSGARYPAEWRVAVPDLALSLVVSPVLADQELDTRPTTGQVYWEGEVTVDGTKQGRPVGGLGYVELTGYTR